jgi:hypothetical protein
MSDNYDDMREQLSRAVPVIAANFVAETFAPEEYVRSRGRIGGVGRRFNTNDKYRPYNPVSPYNADATCIVFPVYDNFTEDLAICTPKIDGVDNENILLGARLMVGGPAISCLETAEQVRCARWAEGRRVEVFDEIREPYILSPIPFGLSMIPRAFLNYHEVYVMVELPALFSGMIDDIHLVGTSATIRPNLRTTVNIDSPRDFFMTQSRLAGEPQLAMAPINCSASFLGIVELPSYRNVEFLYVCGLAEAELVHVGLLSMHNAAEADLKHDDSEQGARKKQRLSASGNAVFYRSGKDVADLHKRIGWDNTGVIIPMCPQAEFSLQNRAKFENAVLDFGIFDSASLYLETTTDIKDIRVYAFTYNVFSTMQGIGGVDATTKLHKFRSVGGPTEMPAEDGAKRGRAET